MGNCVSKKPATAPPGTAAPVEKPPSKNKSDPGTIPADPPATSPPKEHEPPAVPQDEKPLLLPDQGDANLSEAAQQPVMAASDQSALPEPIAPAQPVSTPATDLPPAIDPQKLEEFRDMERDGAPAVVAGLADLYLKQLDERLPALSTFLQQEDAKQLTFTAHSLKGASGNVGAMVMHKCCYELEKTARAGDLVACKPLLDAVIKEAARVRHVLEEERKIDLSEQ